MKSSRCTSAVLGVALLFFAAAPLPAQGAPQGDQAQDGEKPKRLNELTLAGLRPGRDSLAAALKRFKAKYASTDTGSGPQATAKQWGDACTGRALLIQLDDHSLIQGITVSSLLPQEGKCENRRFGALNMQDWSTGRGLRLGDPRDRITELYGEPNSSGPSLKGTTELESLTYAFGWAGPDVPQAMNVYCARDTGRVVEIVLARPSF